MKIGIFDSGRGGLLVANAVRELLPNYNYLYYGDTAHVPYGDRPESEIYTFTKAGVEYLFANGCLIVILACNTASAETLRKLQDEWLPVHYQDRKILGVIVPTIETVREATCTRVLLLATARTVSAGKYHLELGKQNILHAKIIAQAAIELVPLIEDDKIGVATKIAKQHITEHLQRGDVIDGVILGCTHYSLLVEGLRKTFPSIRFFSQTEIIPEKLQSYLTAHTELQTKLGREGTFTAYFTGQEPRPWSV